MILKGKKVILRQIEKTDLEEIRSLINDPEIEKSIVGWSWPISMKDQELWFASYHNDLSMVRYVIETEEDGFVGFTGLKDIDMKNGSATTAGIRIISRVQSKGLAFDAYMTMFKFAFNELRLHRINTSAFEDNIASIKFQEKIGLQREGIQREAIYKDGKFKNVVTFGILANEYFDKATKYGY